MSEDDLQIIDGNQDQNQYSIESQTNYLACKEIMPVAQLTTAYYILWKNSHHTDCKPTKEKGVEMLTWETKGREKENYLTQITGDSSHTDIAKLVHSGIQPGIGREHQKSS